MAAGGVMAGSVAGGDGVAVEGSVPVEGSATCGSKAGGSVTTISASARRPRAVGDRAADGVVAGGRCCVGLRCDERQRSGRRLGVAVGG